MEFRETLLAAQRNQQHKSSESSFYKTRFDPPKKEPKQRDKLSANIQKFLAKKDEEEKQKKLNAQRKRDELLAMRDPKLMNKIKKSLKVFKSANKSVIDDAYDRDNTAVTLNGPEQPDQDDYGYESQEAAAIYAKMMQKYSKIPDEPKFPTSSNSVKKDLNGTRERVKQALQQEDEPVPHKRRRRTNGEKSADGRDESPPSKYEPEKEKRDEKQKSDKPKIRKPMPPPIDFNQLLKLAEQKKSEPLEVEKKKVEDKPKEGERLMTKRQKQEYEEEMARRQRRQQRLDADKAGGRKSQKEEKPVEKDRKTEPSGFGRIPKLNSSSTDRNNSPKPSDRERAEKLQREKDRARQEREKIDKERNRLEKEKLDRDKTDRDKLDRLKAERERIERDIERLNKDRERLEKTKSKLENGRSDKFVDKKQSSSETVKKNVDLKSQNTYRIDKNSNDKKLGSRNTDRDTNGNISHGKSVPKLSRDQQLKNGVKDRDAAGRARAPYGDGKSENVKRLPDSKVPSKRPDDRMAGKPQAGPSKPKLTDSFDFDKHVNSLKKGGPDSANKSGARHLPPSGVKRKPHPDDKRKPNRRVVNSESEYDSEMDDFIDDGEVDMDYSKHIKEIFGYDKSRYRDVDDDDDPNMESSFARQQREEFLSKKIGIMEDLEDMRMEAMEKKKSSKKRRISDD